MSKIRRKVLSAGSLLAFALLLVLGFQNCAPSNFETDAFNKVSNSIPSDDSNDNAPDIVDEDGEVVVPQPTEYYSDGIHNINGLRVRVLEGEHPRQSYNTSQSSYDVIAFRYTAKAHSHYVFTTVRYTGLSQGRDLYLSKVPGDLGASCSTGGRSSQDAVIRAATVYKQGSCQIEAGQVYYLTVQAPTPCSTNQIANSACSMSLSVAYNPLK